MVYDKCVKDANGYGLPGGPSWQPVPAAPTGSFPGPPVSALRSLSVTPADSDSESPSHCDYPAAGHPTSSHRHAAALSTLRLRQLECPAASSTMVNTSIH